MNKQEEIREKQDKILNLVKVWAVIPHPYESRDAEGLLYMLSEEEDVVIKVERELPDFCECCEEYNPDKEDNCNYKGYCGYDLSGWALHRKYVAVEPLVLSEAEGLIKEVT